MTHIARCALLGTVLLGVFMGVADIANASEPECFVVDKTTRADWYQGHKNWRYLPMYKEMTSKSKVIWKLRKGDDVMVAPDSVASDDDWVHAKWTWINEAFPTKEGWVQKRFLVSCPQYGVDNSCDIESGCK
jgi:hypothetical protein